MEQVGFVSNGVNNYTKVTRFEKLNGKKAKQHKTKKQKKNNTEALQIYEEGMCNWHKPESHGELLLYKNCQAGKCCVISSYKQSSLGPVLFLINSLWEWNTVESNVI